MKELIQQQILNSISGPMTVEQLLANVVNKYNLSAITVNVALQDLLTKGDLKMNNNMIEKANDVQVVEIPAPVVETTPELPFAVEPTAQPVQPTVQTVQKPTKAPVSKGGRIRLDKSLNCTQEQTEFAELVIGRKGDIFDTETVLTHRGAQILFAGAGPKAFRYRIGISGYSDKEEVEMPVMYLDWDDTALYDKGGIADQIKELLGASAPKPTIAPAIVAGMAGK